MKNKNKINKFEEMFLMDVDSPDLIKEAFQSSITNIEFATLDNDKKVIAITSSSQSEGKTTFISNLATAYAFDNKKVLLIDCDNRRPNVHKLFNIENTKGLSDLVLESSDYKSCVNECNGVDIITAGVKCPFPATLFNSKNFNAIIEQVSTDYDVVLIDTPPVLAVSDALIISKCTTGLLFLVAEDASKKSELKEVMKQFAEKEINVIGAVVTRSKQAKDRYYRYE